MRKTELDRWKRYFDARNDGLTVERAAGKARMSASTAYRFERGEQSSTGLEAAAILGISIVAGNLVAQPLSPEAKRALEDFAYFRFRYFGRKSTPWQERAAYEVLRVLEARDNDRHYMVMNMPPGSGKSTLFTHDIPCWLIARRRSIRIMLASRTERQARAYLTRIKRTLEREIPLRASSDDLERGIAWDAEAVMQDDFGPFKPEGRSEKWSSEGLVVRQLDDTSLDDKEDTCSAWGADSGFLGGRYDFVVWDDLVDQKNVKTQEARDAIKIWWDDEAESRVEPGGLLLLQGQRISNLDLYRYCLDKKRPDETPKFRHIVYKAHYDDMCTHDHENVKPWPDGCLLDPYRLPWRHLETLHHNNPRTFAVLYQQEDGDIPNGLVDPAWIKGGLDADGYDAPGCLDNERTIHDVPAHLTDTGWSFVTVDPSPTEWWGIIWWLYDPDTENRYIIDLHRRRLNPEQFLTLDLDRMNEPGLAPWSGLMVDLWRTSNDLGVPISHVVVETNAAQKWLLSQPHVQRWMMMTGQRFVPHTTGGANKNDPKYGLESIGDLFRQGRVRIPWGGIEARNIMQPLINEAVRYPDYDTTDLIMSTWFGKLAVENHYTPRKPNSYTRPVPRWLARTARRGIA